MNKKTNKPDVWDTAPAAVEPTTTIPSGINTPIDFIEESMIEKVKANSGINLGFDMEGLMTDFPTATELQKFVYDQTGIVLNLKGRANKVKYQVALDTLNGMIPSQEFIGDENPYVDRNEVIPEDPLRDPPEPSEEILNAGPLVTRFGTNVFPHPDPEWRASDQKAQVVFRKYANGIITYEVLGPVAKRAVGTKINKFGNKQPEKITWVDPRTGEQVIRNANGSLTPLGTRLKSFMSRQKVNKSNQWDTWIDRDFVAADSMIIDNPWGT